MRPPASARHPLFFLAAAAFSALLAAAPVAAQAVPPDPSWDVTVPRGQTRDIDFTTTEGTWTAVDVSPDGTWIAFDLLGHIYRMPIAGGTAQCLTQSSGKAINIQPRISPDGRHIAFISDRKGQMNIWVMDSDGGNATPVYLDVQNEYRWPSWTADGRFILVSKKPALAYNPANVLVLFDRHGGNGVEVLKGETGRNPFRPTLSADGRYVYYDLYTVPPSVPLGRVDVMHGAIQLARLDLRTGVVRQLTAGESEQGNADHPSSGGAYAGQPSPDGRSLAFLRKVPGGTLNYKGQRFGPRSALWIRDLSSGAERLAMDPVEMDMSEESFPMDGTYPPYAWTPDSKSIVIHQGGRIRRLDVLTGAVSTIPYSARVHRTISELALGKTPLSDGPLESRFIRWAGSSPDGKTLAFQAAGRVWLVALPSGTPQRLTPESFAPFEFQPAWSPDGRTIAFSSWQDEQRGALWVADARPGVLPRRVTPQAGEYLNPTWSRDGRELVVLRGQGATARGQTMQRNPAFDVVRIPATGGDETVVVQVAHSVDVYGRHGELVRPTVDTGGRISVYETKPFAVDAGQRQHNVAEVMSVRPDGSDRQVQARIVNAGDAAVSPDGRWVAFVQGMNTYLSPLPSFGAAGTVPLIDKKGANLPVTALSTEGGLSPRWRSATVVEFASGNRFFSYDASSGRAETTTVHLTLPRDVAAGSIALTGARIVTLDQRRVIDRGTVVVKSGRIACVGTCSTAGVDRVVDASGKTIIPGWVDVHAHHDHEHAGMIPAHNFEDAIWLAYGVTTTFDPSPTTTDPFPAAELVETGQMVGPRILSSAESLNNGDDPGTNEVTSLDQAVKEAARRKSWGAPMLKQYLQGTRYQRQWVVEGARRMHMRTTAEGSNDLFYKLGMVMDGHTGGEHLTVQAPLYGDFLTFMAKANYVYSHTPLVSGYGAWNEEYFWQESPVWQDAKLERWIPWRELIPHTRRFIMRPETDYSKDIVAQTIADFIALGGHTAVGSHGQQLGLGSHWDVWMLAKATGPMTALEVASMHGAAFLGLDDDLGSITVGKLGDLMVLNANPLENIRNTANIQYVMKAGVLYDASSLDELWPKARTFGNYYWVAPEMFRVDEKPVRPN